MAKGIISLGFEGGSNFRKQMIKDREETKVVFNVSKRQHRRIMELLGIRSVKGKRCFPMFTIIAEDVA